MALLPPGSQSLSCSSHSQVCPLCSRLARSMFDSPVSCQGQQEKNTKTKNNFNSLLKRVYMVIVTAYESLM